MEMKMLNFDFNFKRSRYFFKSFWLNLESYLIGSVIILVIKPKTSSIKNLVEFSQ